MQAVSADTVMVSQKDELNGPYLESLIQSKAATWVLSYRDSDCRKSTPTSLLSHSLMRLINKILLKGIQNLFINFLNKNIYCRCSLVETLQNMAIFWAEKNPTSQHRLCKIMIY